MSHISNPVNGAISFPVDVTDVPRSKRVKEYVDIPNDGGDFPWWVSSAFDLVDDHEIVAFN